ncbi:AglZ/HisF2 family acetamidino modification protein [Sphingobacterium sp. UBA6320]|uniref:AglZ/HisF2 family acetamidino modification protein n=1 Tax=Sphingobacterium sp. UBA6320 TaxID=1947510 RepID=UPI0025D52C84|nr:AglZ/HisF2 family acetamidino modification protein [Sphingobacterium sp. UBA6320]
MLKPRLIPCILIEDGLVVKTTKFKNSVYIGDPINIVKIFNEKEVDEICVFDISASRNYVEPNFELIGELAKQSRMPLCYGGGIKTYEQAERISNLGVEKIALSSVIFENINVVAQISDRLGLQSVVIVLDVQKRLLGGYDIYIKNGKINTKIDLFTFLKNISSLPYGELIINSIDLDGTQNGYDIALVRKVIDLTSKPITVLGGASTLADISKLFNEFKIIGAGAGSLFIFKGKYKAVLINYPTKEEKKKLYCNI